MGRPFAEGRGTYRYEYMREGTPLGDGTHYLYVNGAYRGNDAIGHLMSDFCQTSADEIAHPLLADRVRYWKESEEGVREMCEIMENMREEARQEGIQQGIQQGVQQGVVASARCLAERMGIAMQEALEYVGVPEPERARYLAMTER